MTRVVTEAGAVAVAGAGAAAAAAADARHKEAGAMERSTTWRSSSVAAAGADTELAAVADAGAGAPTVTESGAGAGSPAARLDAVAGAAAGAAAAPDDRGAALWPPRSRPGAGPGAATVADAVATAAAEAVAGSVLPLLRRSTPADPELPRALASLPPDALRALAAAGGRVSHALHAIEVEALARVADAAAGAGALADAQLSTLNPQLGVFSRAGAEAIRTGRALRALPLLRAAFRAGRLGYEKVRLLTTRATPETEAGWLRLALAHDTESVAAWVVSAPKPRRVGDRLVGPPAPAAPAGCEPLRPLGTRIPEFFDVDLPPERAAELVRLRAALERAAGCRLGPGELFARLAAWYLVRFPTFRTDVVIYHRSPESRVPGAVRVHARFRLIPSPEQRVRYAFRWLRPALTRRARRTPAQPPLPMPLPMPTPEPRPEPEPLPTGGRLCGRPLGSSTSSAPQPASPRPVSERRRISAHVRAAVRWKDGEHCIVPGCRRDLTTQHDHFHEVHAGGKADAAVDHRLCGAHNRAKHRGEIRLFPQTDGTVLVTDGQGRAFGSVEIGRDLDQPLLAWCWAAAEREVLAATTRLPCAIQTYQELAGAGKDSTGPPPLQRAG